MSDNQAPSTPPHTGIEAVDEALAGLDLSGPVAGHPALLAQAQDVLHAVLSAPVDGSAAQ
ncbi:MAG: hypothetical protein WAS07_06745 [Micropruina sp.]|nr:hypothetical protein [Micropruina sp.]